MTTDGYDELAARLRERFDDGVVMATGYTENDSESLFIWFSPEVTVANGTGRSLLDAGGDDAE